VDIEGALAALEADRSHGAGYLARKALGLLAASPATKRQELARRLVALRPAMPAIANAVREAVDTGDPRSTMRRADAERREVAELAAERLRGRTVATMSNSSLVARALLKARPPLTQVVVLGRGDEGELLIAELQANRLTALASSVEDLEAEVAVVGCDAIFDDGAFVNRKGTSALVKHVNPRVVLVLTERWKRVDGPAPTSWPEPDLFEIVVPQQNVELLGVSR
jgi:translation initiation factor 2B subunit (eIF-2B alpha/beta/delta family)